MRTTCAGAIFQIAQFNRMAEKNKVYSMKIYNVVYWEQKRDGVKRELERKHDLLDIYIYVCI